MTFHLPETPDGVQVQTVGFEPYNFFALVITNDLLNCFVTMQYSF